MLVVVAFGLVSITRSTQDYGKDDQEICNFHMLAFYKFIIDVLVILLSTD
jgi:hypothetical protein